MLYHVFPNRHRINAPMCYLCLCLDLVCGSRNIFGGVLDLFRALRSTVNNP